ncbi:MAG TPA: nucleotidyltransferase substrate binding protein [Gammaproteobacteria bacterium]|nr:nucleotidyltransferase substrate binding protein [Gammaproteobacteria bacterium]HRA42425.1 nucleotidyltransferase substrate binding protein [Gammaproteobacteria bacterium]
MALILDPIKKAFLSLTKAMDRSKQNPEDLEVRDACIQRFEYTYELSIKFIKRYIETENPSPENIDQMNYRDFLRLAAEIGLIEIVELWFQFREARNITSHAYDETKAIEVFNVIPSFIQQVNYLLEKLEQRINPS